MAHHWWEYIVLSYLLVESLYDDTGAIKWLFQLHYEDLHLFDLQLDELKLQLSIGKTSVLHDLHTFGQVLQLLYVHGQCTLIDVDLYRDITPVCITVSIPYGLLKIYLKTNFS